MLSHINELLLVLSEQDIDTLMSLAGYTGVVLFDEEFSQLRNPERSIATALLNNSYNLDDIELISPDIADFLYKYSNISSDLVFAY